MAKLEELTIQLNIEGALQKELIKVVEKIRDDHGVIIENIDFHWLNKIGGKGQVLSCQIKSSYYK